MQLGRSLRVCSLTHKFLDYLPSIELQAQLAQQRKDDTTGDTLLVVQHPPVFTIGKRGTPEDFHTDLQELYNAGFQVHTVHRGGETTYHGPGQLVAYPIINLRQLGLGARAFVEGLEDAMVQTAGCFGIQARGRVPGKTGVWVGDRKIGAVGVRLSHGISSHGIALNVTTNLDHYKHIVPCGTPDKEVTSLRQELAHMEWLKATSQPQHGTGQQRLPADGLEQVQLEQSDLGILMTLAEQHLVRSIARVYGYSRIEHVLEADLLVNTL